MPDMEMRRMQEEAARRAREMQARARQPQRPRPAPQNQRDNRPPPKDPPPQPSQPEPQTAEIAVNQPPVPSLLEELFKDRERTVLLALLILLGNEEGSSELMFALLFLLM